MSDAQYICSGTLINNALQDRTPYFLMAYHCGGTATAQQFNQWRFYFFWERTGCEKDSPLADYKMITGATLKVGLPLDGSSDGLLLQLNEEIPREWDVFFNGWDRGNLATAGGAGIHHPAGDVKKISTYTQIPDTYTANMVGGETGATSAHWGVTFVATEHGHSITEGGSSGSPLFNADKRVIGTLTGGNSDCSDPSGTNIYGKMSWHWDMSPNPDLHMAKYLDPNNSGIKYIDGTYGETDWVSFTAGKTSIYASEEITFTNHSYGDIDTYEWDFGANAEPAAYIGQDPPTPVLYNKEGNYRVKLTAKKEDAIVGIFEVPIRVVLKQNYCSSTNPATVGNPGSTTTAPFPLGMNTSLTNYSHSASVYTAAELGIGTDGMITDLEWDAKNATSTVRTLTVYLKETDKSEFVSATTWADEISGLTPLYQGTLNGNPAGTVKIHLTTPFIYSGTKNLEILVQARTMSLANTNSACVYTATATNTHQQWTNLWVEPTGTGTRNGNRPNIKVYYDDPCGAYPPVAGFSLPATTINQGESVKMTDLSTGPVVTYKWHFPGGVPSSSNEVSPTVQYLTAGVYDITLEVINSLGKDSKTVTKAITVNVHTPEPDFASHSNGFTKASDFGPFLPAEGSLVGFENKSRHYPTSIEWSFPGALTASSTEEHPEIVYPAGETTYDVSLSGTNTEGTSNVTKTDYVQVGGTAEVWNVSFGESPSYRYTSNGLGITGSERYQKTAERFEAPAGGEISKIKIFTENVVQNPGSYMTVQLFSDNDGFPGTEISEELRIEGGNNRIANGGYNTFTFTKPVVVSGAFHVVVGSTNYNSIYFTVPCVQNRAGEHSTVSAFFQGIWSNVGRLDKIYTSMHIIPEFTYTVVEMTSPFTYKKKDIDHASETISFNTNGHTWTAEADQWINLSASSGSVSDGIGSLKFTVGENAKRVLRKGTITLNVAGKDIKIYVTQTGAAPIDAEAAYDKDAAGIRVNWKHDSHYNFGENIFDDAEEYASFAKAPQGYYPWSYIDGDGSRTYGFTSEFPGMGKPMSFIVFDTDAFALKYNGLEAHSGTKYFASFAASSGLNNDWLISPELSFEKNFTFSFWAMSLTSYFNGGERFRAVYSTDGNTQADFTNQLSEGTYVVPPLTWTKYTYTVPANAKYVAINCVTEDEFLFMVDDIFIGTEDAPALTAATTPHRMAPAVTDITFNVYRDGELIAGGVTEKTYLDTEDLQSAEYSYSVTAVYGDPELESTESNRAVIQKGNSIDKIHSEKLLKVYPNPAQAGMKFYIASGLNEAELKDAYINVYSLLGVLVQKLKVTGKVTEGSLPSGVYILRLKGEETIVIIK
jgi:PKD repeat protein